MSHRQTPKRRWTQLLISQLPVYLQSFSSVYFSSVSFVWSENCQATPPERPLAQTHTGIFVLEGSWQSRHSAVSFWQSRPCIFERSSELLAD